MKTFSANEILDRFKTAVSIETDSELATYLGIKKATISNWRNRNSVDLPLLFSFCEQVNIDWILTGKGSMLKSTPSLNTVLELEKRPRIPFDAAAGSLSFNIGGVSINDCELMPVIPTFPRYDFTIIVRGDSMYPDFHSGDELACAFVRESQFIQWGRTHVLDTAQGVVLKRIFNHQDSILCRSINKDYPDFDIPKDEVYHLALVIGLIRHF